MGAKGSVEAAKLNADNWGHLEVCMSCWVSSPVLDLPHNQISTAPLSSNAPSIFLNLSPSLSLPLNPHWKFFSSEFNLIRRRPPFYFIQTLAVSFTTINLLERSNAEIFFREFCDNQIDNEFEIKQEEPQIQFNFQSQT